MTQVVGCLLLAAACLLTLWELVKEDSPYSWLDEAETRKKKR